MATASVLTLAAGAAFGYVEVFTKGFERLPTQLCDGAVDRNLAEKVIPPARKVKERGKFLPSTFNFMFACYVRTDDSYLSGEAESGRATIEDWESLEEDSSRGKPEWLSVNGVRALAWEDRALVYVPCTPRRQTGESDHDRERSLIAESRAVGDTRVHGRELRQVLVDFAYQMVRHTYKLGECIEPRTFPDELPRL
ncbi:hypothetical protein ACFVQ4_25650 [Streptomyces laurentii]|uniref:hypothetical protein n=1 Tax=Streptomyces laurentii TaxID=39478 RepID=UPI0036C95F1D